MNKKVIILVCLLLTMCLYGCGHKSNAELVDVEQFRCQDSIETVFEVLGETEFEKKESRYGISYYCRYEDVNLFGYNGELVFNIRDDKKTINDFYCCLNLSDKEYEELLYYFSQKYGSYEVNDKLRYCAWEVSVEDGKVGYEDGEVGFDTISFQDDGNKKYLIFFNDEWSIIKDEVYFEALEESQKPESNWVTLQSKGCEYDGVTMNLSLSEDEEGLFHFSIGLYVEEKWKGAGVYTFAKSLVNVLNEQLEDKGISSTVTMVCDGDLISSVLSYGENEGEVELINVGVWLMEGYQDENFDVEECEQLWVEMENDIYYFLLGDEYMKYKNN